MWIEINLTMHFDVLCKKDVFIILKCAGVFVFQ